MYRWKISIWKDASPRMSSGNCKLKQCDAITHLLDCPKFVTLTTRNADEVVEQQELSYSTGENSEWYRHFGSLPVPYKTKRTLPIWSSNHAPWYWPKEVKHLCPHENLHTHLYGSFIHNYQNLKTTKMSLFNNPPFSHWTEILTAVHRTFIYAYIYFLIFYFILFLFYLFYYSLFLHKYHL